MQDNYYENIKESLINNEITKRVKEYSKNKSDLETYYKVGKLLSEAGKHYGEGIIKKYSIQLTNELGKKYSYRTLNYILKYYNFQKMQPVAAKLTWSHYIELLSLKDINKVNYYINLCINQSLSRNDLRKRIKSKEYERLPDSTKNKLINSEKTNIKELIPEPIIIKSNLKDKELISEKILHRLIVENIKGFMNQLGSDYSYVSDEYKIKIGDSYNYIDLLLFNIKYNCYVVVELKVTSLKKEHIGQIEIYMNYIDQNIKTIYQDNTIGIILVKRNNEFIIEYSSDDRIISRKYEIK